MNPHVFDILHMFVHLDVFVHSYINAFINIILIKVFKELRSICCKHHRYFPLWILEEEESKVHFQESKIGGFKRVRISGG